jgi:hypothetical protein
VAATQKRLKLTMKDVIFGVFASLQRKQRDRVGGMNRQSRVAWFQTLRWDFSSKPIHTCALFLLPASWKYEGKLASPRDTTPDPNHAHQVNRNFAQDRAIFQSLCCFELLDELADMEIRKMYST